MTIDFTCQKCESSFEIDAQDLVDGTEKLVCPHCNAKAPASVADDFTSALGEIRAQVAAMASRFSVSMTVETEDVEEELETEEEDEDEDEGEEGDDELDFDEDDESEDEDEEEYEDEDMDDR